MLFTAKPCFQSSCFFFLFFKYILLFLTMCMHVYLYMGMYTHVWLPLEARGIESLDTGVSFLSVFKNTHDYLKDRVTTLEMW